MYPVHDLCNMYRYMVSKHRLNFMTIVWVIPIYSLMGNFETLHAARAACQ